MFKMLILPALLALGGCATPLGQQYSAVGAVSGAIIGGITDGGRGAGIGAALGAAAGGLIGDQRQFEYMRAERPYSRYQRYDTPCYHCGSRPSYVEPCRYVREPVYNDDGVVGWREVCR